MRHKLLYAFERAERAESEAEERAWLNFVIVGAGATGLELAGAIAEIAHHTLKHDFRRIRPQEARIILMEGGPRVLPPYPEDLSAKAEKLVKNLGVKSCSAPSSPTLMRKASVTSTTELPAPSPRAPSSVPAASPP